MAHQHVVGIVVAHASYLHLFLPTSYGTQDLSTTQVVGCIVVEVQKAGESKKTCRSKYKYSSVLGVCYMTYISLATTSLQ